MLCTPDSSYMYFPVYFIKKHIGGVAQSTLSCSLLDVVEDQSVSVERSSERYSKLSRGAKHSVYPHSVFICMCVLASIKKFQPRIVIVSESLFLPGIFLITSIIASVIEVEGPAVVMYIRFVE